MVTKKAYDPKRFFYIQAQKKKNAEKALQLASTASQLDDDRLFKQLDKFEIMQDIDVYIKRESIKADNACSKDWAKRGVKFGQVEKLPLFKINKK